MKRVEDNKCTQFLNTSVHSSWISKFPEDRHQAVKPNGSKNSKASISAFGTTNLQGDCQSAFIRQFFNRPAFWKDTLPPFQWGYKFEVLHVDVFYCLTIFAWMKIENIWLNCFFLKTLNRKCAGEFQIGVESYRAGFLRNCRTAKPIDVTRR